MTSQRVEEAVDRLRARPKPDNPDITTLIDWYDLIGLTGDGWWVCPNCHTGARR